MTLDPERLKSIGRELGELVAEKSQAYGDAFSTCGAFLLLLYPGGIRPGQFGDALALARIFDKCKRIATRKDAFGESPFRDIAGYGVLGVAKDELEAAEELRGDSVPTGCAEGCGHPECAPATFRGHRVCFEREGASPVVCDPANRRAIAEAWRFGGEARATLERLAAAYRAGELGSATLRDVCLEAERLTSGVTEASRVTEAARPPAERRVVLIVRRRKDVGELFPGGVAPAGVEVFSEASPLDGLRASLVLLGPGLGDDTIRTAHGIAAAGGGRVELLEAGELAAG